MWSSRPLLRVRLGWVVPAHKTILPESPDLRRVARTTYAIPEELWRLLVRATQVI